MSGPSSNKQQTPQEIIDEFWARFTTKTPGRATTVVPSNPYADRVARKSAKAASSSVTATASYEEAAAMCQAKVAKIVKECRRINKKYRDPYFDVEADLKRGRRDCLESLSNLKQTGRKKPRRPGQDFNPRSAKRVVEIFDKPEFYINGPTANDVRQGRDGDCWLMAALCLLSNMPGLIEKLCVAHDQDVGVYGFVFHRDGEWISEIVDDFVRLPQICACRSMHSLHVLRVADLAIFSSTSPSQTTTTLSVSIPRRHTVGSTSPTAVLSTLRSVSIPRRLGCRCWRNAMPKLTATTRP
jgi:hypothetical protein